MVRLKQNIKHKIKKQDGEFIGAMMAPFAASLIAPVASLLINLITGKWPTRARKGQEDGILQLLALPLMMKVLGKGVRRAGKGYNNTNKNF